MLRILSGVVLIAHAVVHLLYAGQSNRTFELQAGMTWPDGAWLFSRLLGNEPTRALASATLLLAALGFVSGAAGLIFMQAWWRPVVVGAAALSAVAFMVFWDGALQDLPAKGAVGILISVAILVAVLIFQWPNIAPASR